jgi:hypothetical protein
MRWLSPPLRDWLRAQLTEVGTYRHSLLAEDTSQRQAGLEALTALSGEAHSGARERLELLVGESLDPTGGSAPPGWQPYPQALHTSVLQGYLGELLAGLIAENYQPHGRTWVVPAFLFRGHLAAYQALERQRQLGGPARPIPGRTGDDAFAFEVDDEGGVVAWLLAEAKCTHDHDASLVSKGHEQLSLAIRVPVDLLQLIEVLQESRDPEAERWIAAIREVLYSAQSPPRYDMFVYVCGRKPVQRETWIPNETPHESYTAEGPLHAVEIQLEEFDDVLIAAYPGHRVARG